MKIIMDGALITVEPYGGKQGRRFHRQRIWCDGRAIWLSPAMYRHFRHFAEYSIEHDVAEFAFVDIDVSVAIAKNLRVAMCEAGRMWYRPFSQIASTANHYKTWRWNIPLSSIEMPEENLGRLIQGFVSVPRPQRYERCKPLTHPIGKDALNVHDLQHAPAHRFANYITGIMAGETEYQRTRT